MRVNVWALTGLGRQLTEGRRIFTPEEFAGQLVELGLNDATAALLERLTECAPVWESPEAVDLRDQATREIAVKLHSTLMFSFLRGDLLGQEHALIP